MRLLLLLIMNCIMINMFYCSNIFADKLDTHVTVALENTYNSSVVCNTLAPKHLLKDSPSIVRNVFERYNFLKKDLKDSTEQTVEEDESNIDEKKSIGEVSEIRLLFGGYVVYLAVLFLIIAFFNFILWFTPLRVWSFLVCGIVFILFAGGYLGYFGTVEYIFREVKIIKPGISERDKIENSMKDLERHGPRTLDEMKKLYEYHQKNKQMERKFNNGEALFLKHKERGWMFFLFDSSSELPVFSSGRVESQEYLENNDFKDEKKCRVLSVVDGCRFNIKIEKYNDDIQLIEESALGNVKRVKELLAKGTSVDEQTYDGRTALCEACRNNQTEIVKLLLKANAKLDIKPLDKARSGGYSGVTERNPLPLEEAVRNEDIEIVKILLNNGAGFYTNKDKDKEVIFKDHEKNKEIKKIFTAKNKRRKEINKKYLKICFQDDKDIEITKQYLENIEAILDNIKEKDDDKEKNINDVLTYIVKNDKFPCYYYIKNTMFLKKYLLELIAEVKKQGKLEDFSEIEFKHSRVNEVNKWTKEDLVKLFRFIEEAA